MALYQVKKINLDCVHTVDEYQHAVNEAEIQYCNSLKEVEQFCGGKLVKQYAGYSGTKHGFEYVAIKVR